MMMMVKLTLVGLDFARTFPPERLHEGENSQLIFSRLLRPEFAFICIVFFVALRC